MAFDKKQIVIAIPALDPDQKLLDLLGRLRQSGYTHIILVNDGSAPEYDAIFCAAQQQYGCCVLHHCVNQGKGRALKTAFNEFLQNFADKAGVVTVDADGQHQIDDINACAASLWANRDKLTMGCRDFGSANVPLRSKFGNILTRHVFSALCGVKVSDTQTGLRAIPTALVRKFLATVGERFEYEMNMLIDCKQYGVQIVEVPIATVYLEENASSHFNPLLDSIRIYSVFFKFIASSLSSFVVDILFFTAFTALLKPVLPGLYILAATVLARLISSAVNYLLNKKTVFQDRGKNRYALPKYYTLAAVQMLCSAFFVTKLYSLVPLLNESVIKMLVDTVLFLLSFKVQQNWVFKGRKEER
ncbi:MAG TPA: bifunctional glycosyltransferase family 2/GtrA family protein [Candidatus Gemmiger excrementipullorum]|uniref:Bifunctional glycosyltransferase family 2/GtrA family protein n=1 Tax=Candidatus Gemmiger excrementipullorum TaxID=2838610 RepID=A0A9D2BVC7_9FIRM|nr:bifunctional glycosyltransferase family 2/GtrA family protein [Candidatus Gemmiger excrementipullorum]